MVKLSILSQDEGREVYQSQNMGHGAKATPKRFKRYYVLSFQPHYPYAYAWMFSEQINYCH